MDDANREEEAVNQTVADGICVTIPIGNGTLGSAIAEKLGATDYCTEAWNSFREMHHEAIAACSKKGDGMCPTMEFAFRAGWMACQDADLWGDE